MLVRLSGGVVAQVLYTKVERNGRCLQFFEKPVTLSLAGWLDNTVRRVDHTSGKV